jgi:hypothetical protein
MDVMGEKGAGEDSENKNSSELRAGNEADSLKAS